MIIEVILTCIFGTPVLCFIGDTVCRLSYSRYHVYKHNKKIEQNDINLKKKNRILCGGGSSFISYQMGFVSVLAKHSDLTEEMLDKYKISIEGWSSGGMCAMLMTYILTHKDTFTIDYVDKLYHDQLSTIYYKSEKSCLGFGAVSQNHLYHLIHTLFTQHKNESSHCMVQKNKKHSRIHFTIFNHKTFRLENISTNEYDDIDEIAQCIVTSMHIPFIFRWWYCRTYKMYPFCFDGFVGKVYKDIFKDTSKHTIFLSLDDINIEYGEEMYDIFNNNDRIHSLPGKALPEAKMPTTCDYLFKTSKDGEFLYEKGKVDALKYIPQFNKMINELFIKDENEIVLETI
jgi:hypothetical protein